MSGPKDGRGPDAFDDFFGDPTPSGRMGPAPAEREPDAEAKVDADDEPTRDIDLRGEDTVAAPTRPATPEPEPRAEPSPGPVPTGAVPEDWWTSEPGPPSPAAAPSPTWHAGPVPQAQPAGRPPRKGVSPFALVAMLIGGVLLGGVFVGGAVMALNEDDGEAVASETTVTETSSETTETTEPTSTSSTPSSSSSSTTSSSSSTSSSPTRSGELPAGVTSCSGPKSGTAVGRGTEITSCDFAVAVRDAYLAARSTGSASLEVRSPVTKESYTMSCSGQAVTRCTGGNNAVVVLY